MSKICIFIHGYLTNYTDFQGLPKAIMEEYDKVILLTLPGHNHIDSLNNFTKDNVFKYIKQEMEQIKDGNTIDVVGYSLGGALAWYIALNYKINKLVLLAPANNYLNIFLYSDKRKYLKSIRKYDIETQKILKDKLRKQEKDALDFVKKYTYPKFNLKNGYIFCTIISEINKNKSKVDVPLLIVRGDLDEIVPKKSGDTCYKRCINSNKEIYTIPGIGHLLLRTEEEQTIINKVKQFLISRV